MTRPKPSTPFDFSQEDHDLFRDIHAEIGQSLIDEPLDLDPYLASPEELARVELLFPPAPATRPAMKVTVFAQSDRKKPAHDASSTWTVHTPGKPE